MKKGLLCFFLAGGLCLLVWTAGQGRIYIDIDSPQFRPTPMAIGELKNLTPNAADGFGVGVAHNLSRLLGLTGFFSLISPQAFLEKPGEKINFSNWSAIGAEYLVTGSYVRDQGGYVMEMRLYDVLKGEVIGAGRYTGTFTDQLDVARKMARDILKTLSGDGGVFFTRLAFVVRKGRGTEIGTISFDGTDYREVTRMKSLSLSPRWSPDGRYLAFMSYQGKNPCLFFYDTQEGATRIFSALPGLNLPGAWSPDGKTILATLSVDGNQEIYALDVLTGKRQRLTYDPDIDVSPVWSPDGKSIAFVSDRSGSPQIFVMNADGTGVRRLTFSGNYNTSPAWSPKGDRILYEGRKEGRFQIFSLAVSGGDPVQITSGSEHRSPSWSPDGRFIACTVLEGGKERVVIMNAGGMNARYLADGSQPSWSYVLEK
ncbi:MAG TPA: Tol-Pal system beta propeller repeat protein TolB [Syntrophales bacterium]|nr:Tol-Pal system beta propeller repeat protein TolB [Syntrophales bacterium]HOL58345.1 Tol-Pal system beta propeller repeat protein TolB [Syntrophales bacterium]HPO34514.1 Tol-Pal system beta propeller repeat protein TolB [Syntrophales bacterium]